MKALFLLFVATATVWVVAFLTPYTLAILFVLYAASLLAIEFYKGNLAIPECLERAAYHEDWTSAQKSFRDGFILAMLPVFLLVIAYFMQKKTPHYKTYQL